MRAYLEFSKKSFQEMLAYRAELLIRLLGVSLGLYLLYTFWKGLYASSIQVEGIPFQSMLTYAVISAVTGGIRNVFGILQMYITSWMARKARTGEIIMDMLKPTDFQLYLFSHSLGRLLFNLIFSVPVVLAAYLIFRFNPPYSGRGLVLFLVSLGLSYLLLFLIDFLVSLISFWTTQSRGAESIARYIMILLSGSFIPLWFFPDWARGVLSYLPFASIYHAPLSIYIGKIRGSEALDTILLQAIWIIVLFILGRFLWSRSKRHLMVHGG